MAEVSVILPAYNAEKYLEQAVNSILQQTFADLELLVWDDGSTDTTPQILQRLAGRDSRIKLLGGVNVGVAAALNRLIDASDSPWIFRMDADDISRQDRIEKQLAHCKSNRLDICGTFISYIDKKKIRQYPVEDGELKHGMYYWGRTFAHPAVAFSRRVFDFVKYTEEYRSAQDIDLWFQCLSVGDLRFGNSPEALLCYRRHEGQISEKRRSQQDAVAAISLRRAIEQIFPALTDMHFDMHVRANHKNGLARHELDDYVSFISALNAEIISRHGDSGGLTRWYKTLVRKHRPLFFPLLKRRPQKITISDVVYGLA